MDNPFNKNAEKEQAILNDESISVAARGLLLTALHGFLDPLTYNPQVPELYEEFDMELDKILDLLRELQKAGYVRDLNKANEEINLFSQVEYYYDRIYSNN